jgi:DNA adenine methylase
LRPTPAGSRTRTHGRHGNTYGQELRGEDEHRQLAEALTKARAAVVLSAYHSPLYDELYDGWHQVEMTTFTGNAIAQRQRTEVLWSNRPFPGIQGELADLFATQENRTS